MERLEVLSKSKELVDQIYENMRTIETCDAVAESIKELDLCFSDMDNKQIVSMEGVLSRGQQKELRELVIAKIYSNASGAQSFLERLYRKPATINPEFEAAVQRMESKGKARVDQDSKETEMPTKTELAKIEKMLDENLREEAKRIEELPVPLKPSEILEKHSEEIEKMYKVQMATVGAIAEKFGVKKTDVNTFLAKHKLFRKTYKKDDGFLDAKVQARQSQDK